MEIEKEYTPNFWPDRKGEIVRGIVIHVTEGSYESAKDWITRPESSASYNFIIKEDGTPVQFVPIESAAWANGLAVDPKWRGINRRVNANLYTVSIAYAGTAALGPNIQQFFTLALLSKSLAAQLNLIIDTNTLIPHNEIRADKTCPGNRCDLKALRYLSSLSLAAK